MTKVNVFVTLRESVVDPQGTAAKGALHSLGFGEVKDVRVGKLIELELEGTPENLEERVQEMCSQLLVNQVIEDYKIDIKEAHVQ